MSDICRTKVGPQGRILLPKAVREAAGLEPGATVTARVDDGRVILSARAGATRRLRGLIKDVDHSVAEELIAERRAAAETERR